MTFFGGPFDDGIVVVSLETGQMLGDLREDEDRYYFDNHAMLGNTPQFVEYHDTSLENVKKQLVALFAEI